MERSQNGNQSEYLILIFCRDLKKVQHRPCAHQYYFSRILENFHKFLTFRYELLKGMKEVNIKIFRPTNDLPETGQASTIC